MDQINPEENLITQNTCLGVMIKLIDWLNEWVRWTIVRGFHPLNLQSTCCMQVQPYRGRRWKHWIETPISVHLVLSQFISMSICILIKIVYPKIYSVYWGKNKWIENRFEIWISILCFRRCPQQSKVSAHCYQEKTHFHTYLSKRLHSSIETLNMSLCRCKCNERTWHAAFIISHLCTSH